VGMPIKNKRSIISEPPIPPINNKLLMVRISLITQ
jgi:hypothetical protein